MSLDFIAASMNCIDESPKTNLGIYGAKGVVGVISALFFQRITKSSLKALSIASLACTAVPIGTFLVFALWPKQTDKNGKEEDGGLPSTILFVGAVAAGLVGGMQTVYLGTAAKRIWNGAASGLSLGKKTGLALMFGLSGVELIGIKGFIMSKWVCVDCSKPKKK